MTLHEHAAPGTSAAFDYQFQRALYWLATSQAGCQVGIETDDDVAVRRADGSLQALEQDKHSIRAVANSFSDRSLGLWKTLATWAQAVQSAEVTAAQTAFFLVTNKEVPPGLASRISESTSDAEIDECIKHLQKIGAEASQILKPFASAVLAGENLFALREVVRNCQLLDGRRALASNTLLSEVTSRLQLPGWSLAQAGSIVDELLGWMHRHALATWQGNRPYWISRDHFVNQLHAILDRRRRLRDRERAEHLLPVDDELLGEQRGRPFVRQLHLVTEDSSFVDGAIRDFVRCGIEKSRLSTEGNIADEDWVAFEAELISRWERIRSRVMRLSRELPEEDQGFEVLTETTEEYRSRLAGAETDQIYLTSGTYHRLADATKVGWHPRFVELLSEHK